MITLILFILTCGLWWKDRFVPDWSWHIAEQSGVFTNVKEINHNENIERN